MAVNSLNLYSEITNTYNVSGSCFPKGIRSGNTQLPGQLNPGAPIGLVHMYRMPNPVQSAVIATASGTGALTTYLPLRGIALPVAQYVQDIAQGMQFDFPRQLSFTCTQQCTLVFNITDRYGRKAVNVSVGTSSGGNFIGGTNMGVAIINSIQFITTTGSAWTLSVSTTNFFELPYTDMGKQLFYEYHTLSTNTNPQVAITSTSSTGPAPYKFDMVYTKASWGTPITTLSGLPRPLIKLQNAGVDINLSTATYDYSCQQIVFPYYTPNLSWLMTPQQAESGETSIGLTPDATGWVGWKG